MLNVEKFLHEVGLGAKGQSNLEIAGSPRNSSRTSLGKLCGGGKALIGLGLLPEYQPHSNSECRSHVPREAGCGG